MSIKLPFADTKYHVIIWFIGAPMVVFLIVIALRWLGAW